MTWFLYSGGRRTAVADDVEIVVGRAAECDVVVDDPRVSRHHLVVVVHGATGGGSPGQWTISDRSANGTFLDGRPAGTRTGENGLTLHLGDPDGPSLVLTTDPAWVPATVDVPAAVAHPGGPLGCGSRSRPPHPGSR